MEFLVDISTFIHIATLGVSALLAAIIYKRESYYKTANRYLLLLLVSIGVVHINAALILGGYDQAHYYVQNLSNAFILLLGPAIYLSIRNRGESRVKTKREFLHFVPFMAYALVILLGFTGPTFFEFFEQVEPVAFLMFVIQVPTYIVMSLKLIRNEKNDLFTGVKVLLVGLLLTYSIQLIMIIVELTIVELPNAVTINSSLLFSFAVLAFSYKCLSNDKVLFAQPRYAQSGMNREQTKDIMNQIKTLVESERLFTNSDLKVGMIAECLKLSSKQVSQAINQKQRMNFTDFINAYRVQYIASLLIDPKNQHYTLLAIAEMGGFKSGSVFNAAFKKHMGMLPSAYRKQ